jgi:hypothetical protein
VSFLIALALEITEMRYKHSDIKKVAPIELPCKKAMYNSLEEAQDMILYIKENRSIKEIHAYKCEFCGFWHLTSKSK